MQTKKNEHIGNTISCPLSTKDVNIAECQGLNCCLLTLVKEKWKMAGLPIIKDNQIKKKIETLHKVYSSLRESRLGPKVTSFLKDAPKLFDIALKVNLWEGKLRPSKELLLLPVLQT